MDLFLYGGCKVEWDLLPRKRQKKIKNKDILSHEYFLYQIAESPNFFGFFNFLPYKTINNKEKGIIYDSKIVNYN